MSLEIPIDSSCLILCQTQSDNSRWLPYKKSPFSGGVACSWIIIDLTRDTCPLFLCLRIDKTKAMYTYVCMMGGQVCAPHHTNVRKIFPGGTPHMKGVGMLVGNFKLNP